MKSNLEELNDWELDFTCLILRLRQIKRQGGFNADINAVLADRILTSDLPRMEQYLTEKMLAALKESEM